MGRLWSRRRKPALASFGGCSIPRLGETALDPPLGGRSRPLLRAVCGTNGREDNVSGVGKVEGRGSALWGNGGGRKRRLLALVGIVAALAAVAGISARTADAAKVKALVPKDLLAQAQANPSQLFDVIVQGSRGVLSNKV